MNPHRIPLVSTQVKRRLAVDPTRLPLPKRDLNKSTYPDIHPFIVLIATAGVIKSLILIHQQTTSIYGRRMRSSKRARPRIQEERHTDYSNRDTNHHRIGFRGYRPISRKRSPANTRGQSNREEKRKLQQIKVSSKYSFHSDTFPTNHS